MIPNPANEIEFWNKFLKLDLQEDDIFVHKHSSDKPRIQTQ